MANTIRLKRGTVEPTAGSLVTGEVAINTTNGNAYTLTDAGDVVQIGASAVSLTATVRNETGATLTKGQVVYLNGASGNKPLAVLAQANSEATSSGTYGLVQADIANNNNGTIVIAGFINKLNTQGYTDGDKVYLSPTTAGGWTTTKPSAPNHMVFLGTITYAHQTQGAIQLRIANGFEIEELHNVSISGVADKDIISYNSSTGLYENRTISALGIQTSAAAAATYAPLASPTFTGNVTAGTNLISANSSGDEGGEILLAKPQTNTTLSGTGVTIDVYQNKLRIFEQGGSARGAYIDLTAAGAGVATNLLSGGATNASWGSITGTLSSQSDLNTALGLKAPLASPTFTGIPAAPTAAADTNTTQVATTAFVVGQASSATPLINGTAAVGTSLKFARADHVHPTDTTRAPLASPTFTGVPAAPTATAGTNTTQLATTAFVTTAVSTKANLASPAFTGTPTAPTAASSTNSTQIATTAYVKTNLSSYATTSSPSLTGSPTSTTTATSNDSNQIATTSFVKANIRKPVSYFNGDLNSFGALEENVCYVSNTSAAHTVTLYNAGYLNSPGTILMFRQEDNSQIAFNSAYVSAPNNDRYFAAFPGAVIFAIKGLSYYWHIYGDLISTQYQAYGTFVSGPTLDSSNTTGSGIMDYNGVIVPSYTYYELRANGWGGTYAYYLNAPYGTQMSGTYQGSAYDYYHLAADGNGGYYTVFEYSSGGGNDPYGTKYGTPYWDSGQMALYQNIADGTGGTTSIPWDGNAPYPTSGTQVSTPSNGDGYLTDAIGASYYVYYTDTYYADGNGGSTLSRTVQSGNNWPQGWAFDGYHVDTNRQNTMTYWYDSSYNYVYPYDYGYNGADGMGNAQWFSASGGSSWYPSYGTQMTPAFYDQSNYYGYYQADGYGGYSFSYL